MLIVQSFRYLEDIRKTPFIAGEKSPAAIKGAYQIIFYAKENIGLVTSQRKILTLKQ